MLSVKLPMDPRDIRAREIENEIRTVLYEDWNPIGFAGVLPRDEYDTYIGGVYRLLAKGASVTEVADHLASIELREIGFEVTAEALHEVAAKLCKMDVRLDRGGAT
jgi:hypothetical protein